MLTNAHPSRRQIDAVARIADVVRGAAARGPVPNTSTISHSELRVAGLAKAVSVILLALGLGVGCRKENASRVATGDKPLRPLLLIGVDGLEWDVIIPLLAEGKLPNLATLMRRGEYGLLQTFVPTYSPVVWTSVATGKFPDKHGITDFALHDRQGNPHLFSNAHRTTKALWNILSDYHKRVCVIGWWMTYPVEPVNGVMVAQTNTLAQLDTAGGKNVWKGMLLKGIPRQVYPPTLQNQAMSILETAEAGLDDLTTQVFGRFRHPLSPLAERLWSNCRWAFRADATYLQIATHLVTQEQPFDLTMVYFGGPDVVGHRFWRYMQPDIYDHKPPPEQVENLGQVIQNYYSYIDSAVGQLLAVAPADVTVLIASDHGMKPINLDARFDPQDPPADVNSAHHIDAPPGVLIAAGPVIRPSSVRKPPEAVRPEDLPTVGTVLDIAPTILALTGIPLGADMDGRVMTRILRTDALVPSRPDTVETHDTPEFLASRPEPVQHDASQQERLRQLRSLGYVGGGER